MKLKKFMGIIAAVSIIASAGSVGASAAEELPIGYVTVSGGRTAYRLCNRQRREIHAWSGIHT